VVEIFERYLAGWGFKEIANHLNRQGGPPCPSHVDPPRNAARQWAKTTIRSILENPVYTGRLYWNRLDFRQAKQGEGPVIRRERDEWIEAERRHEPLIPAEWVRASPGGDGEAAGQRGLTPRGALGPSSSWATAARKDG
jgi:hypothetical protein